ncbi:MAG: 3-deoxy-7-phosphoheptulonate synthase [Bdellovibrionota bacterium]
MEIESNNIEFPLSAQKSNKEKTQIHVGLDTVVAGQPLITFKSNSFLIIAGPCSIESEEQAFDIARAVKKSGAHILRGGAFKPRTSPYSFQGLGNEGLAILAKVKKELQIPIITEVLDVRDLEAVAEVADIIQIGTRNMQNFSLLKEVGKINKPVMLKRGLAATIKEWLLSAEYILKQGNENVILCERGIRSFDPETRNLLDLSAVALIREMSHLPVIVDPSHALGRRDLIEPMSKAALACGSYGVMIEVHDRPEEALSDGAQAINYADFDSLTKNIKKFATALDIQVP